MTDITRDQMPTPAHHDADPTELLGFPIVVADDLPDTDPPVFGDWAPCSFCEGAGCSTCRGTGRAGAGDHTPGV